MKKAVTTAMAVVSVILTSACTLSVDSSESKEKDAASYSGCLKDKDVYVTIEDETLSAARSAVCASNQTTNPELLGDLPSDLKANCVTVDGLGLGALVVKWNDQEELVTSQTCEPL